jgi:hypothetical protein
MVIDGKGQIGRGSIVAAHDRPPRSAQPSFPIALKVRIPLPPALCVLDRCRASLSGAAAQSSNGDNRHGSLAGREFGHVSGGASPAPMRAGQRRDGRSWFLLVCPRAGSTSGNHVDRAGHPRYLPICGSVRCRLSRMVLEGLSPKRFRYSLAKRPRWEKPQLVAISATPSSLRGL